MENVWLIMAFLAVSVGYVVFELHHKFKLYEDNLSELKSHVMTEKEGNDYLLNNFSMQFEDLRLEFNSQMDQERAKTEYLQKELFRLNLDLQMKYSTGVSTTMLNGEEKKNEDLQKELLRMGLQIKDLKRAFTSQLSEGRKKDAGLKKKINILQNSQEATRVKIEKLATSVKFRDDVWKEMDDKASSLHDELQNTVKEIEKLVRQVRNMGNKVLHLRGKIPSFKTVDSCPLGLCMEKKIDLEAAFKNQVKHQSTGTRLTFRKDIFSFSCSVFDMFMACVNDLDHQQLDKCIPFENRALVFRLLSLVDRDACSKSKRLDKLVPCMNDQRIQQMFFGDLLFFSFQLWDSQERNENLPCQDFKTTYLYALGKLSKSCDNDGLIILLEILIKFASEIRNLAVLELTEAAGFTLNEICFDAILNATTTAKDDISNGNIKDLWGL